jgi:hypothetical protein
MFSTSKPLMGPETFCGQSSGFAGMSSSTGEGPFLGLISFTLQHVCVGVVSGQLSGHLSGDGSGTGSSIR